MTTTINPQQLRDTANRTRKDANELEAHTVSSSNQLNANLETYEGDARNELNKVTESNKNDTLQKAEAFRNYADYLDEVAKTYEDADNYCATAKI